MARRLTMRFAACARLPDRRTPSARWRISFGQSTEYRFSPRLLRNRLGPPMNSPAKWDSPDVRKSRSNLGVVNALRKSIQLIGESAQSSADRFGLGAFGNY